MKNEKISSQQSNLTTLAVKEREINPNLAKGRVYERLKINSTQNLKIRKASMKQKVILEKINRIDKPLAR